ncbi:MAG TPA: hypothetical protein VEF34_10535 [Syntrophobacteraceae bacterium]|nr:hypothetical protein [Syntrophobacteraceae bacterium]
MKRKPIAIDVQAAVLLRSRRRCCLCFGLNRDTSIKQGQIAHLDHDPANGAEDNLVFLCLDHHDQYDSTTGQSKNFTITEVKKYRLELYSAVKLAFDTEVSFGKVKIMIPEISGHYIRMTQNESAELKVKRMEDGRYHFSGLALWGRNREYGPNIGELDFIGDVEDNAITYSCPHPDGTIYRITLLFLETGMSVTEENSQGMFGMNVSFAGEYGKA